MGRVRWSSCPNCTSLLPADVVPPFRTPEAKEWRSLAQPCSSPTRTRLSRPGRALLSTPCRLQPVETATEEPMREAIPVHMCGFQRQLLLLPCSSNTPCSGSHERQEAFLSLPLPTRPRRSPAEPRCPRARGRAAPEI